MYLQPTALAMTGRNLALGGEDRRMEHFKWACCIPNISTKLTTKGKGTCTHVAVQGKRHHHWKTLKLHVAWLALGCPCCNYQGGEHLPCEPGKAPSSAGVETVADGRLLSCGTIPPKMGKGQDGKKKYVMHLLFKQSALCVIFSPVLSILGRFHRTVCSYGWIWAQEQKLQWDPQLNQPLLQWFANSGSTGTGLLIQWRIFIILIEIFLIS